ncbi:MAG: type I-E CRISPR-associated protein Cse2/CasB [Deltaproteobacteria bacterium]|nr:type I-E CRISPR-associated protein Cse2/CasB [Deltaproteobacteria bacterium]
MRGQLPTTSRDDGLHAFVEHLYELAEREDRGALAALRRSLQDPTGMSAAACPYVVPFLPREPDLYRERAYFLVAALFALDGRHATGVSLGDAYRRIHDAARSADGTDNPSIRARFVALLDAHPEDAGEHVRHAASLARAKEVALDWEQLLRDLLSLRHPDRWVQRQWARDFWGRTSTDEGSTPSLAEVNR